MIAGLPPRLDAVASQVLVGRPMADIGTDHALLPAALVRAGTVPSAIAMDIASGPLKNARGTLKGLEHLVDVRQSDGLNGLLVGEVATICIGGMGGTTMAGILDRGRAVWTHADRLVLQPQGMPQRVRQVMLGAGWDAVFAVVVEDRHKLFTIETWEPVGLGSAWDDLDLRWGRLVRAQGSALFVKALNRERKQVEDALQRMKEVGSDTHPDAERLVRNQQAIVHELERCGVRSPSG